LLGFKERATGKSTFIKWLKSIFGLNMTYIKGDSFNSQFNSDWTSMLIVAIDEVFLKKRNHRTIKISFYNRQRQKGSQRKRP
jgi:uridine kinase